MATIILGASSLIGAHLIQRLHNIGDDPICLTRSKQRVLADASFRHFDPSAASPLADKNDDVLSLVPLRIAASLLPRLSHARRFVALGSTSLHSKIGSTDPQEKKEAKALAAAESTLIEAYGTGIVILRPTLIYDGLRDRNVTAIARMARSWGIVPIASPGKGLRQPIHANDVAAAIEAVLARWNEVATSCVYDLPGTDTMTYTEMVARIIQAAAPQARILPIPVRAIETGLRLMRLLGSSYTVGAANRMNADQAYDGATTWQRLGFEPRPFHPCFPPSDAASLDNGHTTMSSLRSEPEDRSTAFGSIRKSEALIAAG